MKALRKLYLVLVYVLLYAPILVLVIFSFNQSKDLVHFTGFTFKWYEELFTGSAYLDYLKNTLILAMSASLLSTVLGTAAALGISRMRARTRGAVLAVNNVPMTNPEIVTGVSLALLFIFAGRLIEGIFGVEIQDTFGFVTLLIAHVTFDLPYVLLSVLPKMSDMDPNLTDAALDLGCTPLQTFFKVILPHIMPGVISGLTMAFMLSLDDFVISYFVSGTTFQTLPVMIYSETRKPMSPTIYALFTLMFVIMFILLVLTNVAGARKEQKKKEVQR